MEKLNFKVDFEYSSNLNLKGEKLYDELNRSIDELSNIDILLVFFPGDPREEEEDGAYFTLKKLTIPKDI